LHRISDNISEIAWNPAFADVVALRSIQNQLVFLDQRNPCGLDLLRDLPYSRGHAARNCRELLYYRGPAAHLALDRAYACGVIVDQPVLAGHPLDAVDHPNILLGSADSQKRLKHDGAIQVDFFHLIRPRLQKRFRSPSLANLLSNATSCCHMCNVSML